MTDGRTGTRLRVLGVVCVFMFGALAVRLWFVQILASDQYKIEVQHNGIRFVPDPAPRGLIRDRQGNVLVGNRPSLVVTVNRQLLGSREEAVLFHLSKLLSQPVSDLVHSLNDVHYYAYTPVPVAFDVSKEVAFYIGEHQAQFPGVSTETIPVRTYREGKLAAHVLGSTGQISAEQLKSPQFAGYSSDAIVGRTGVESSYESSLQGTAGERKYRVNAAGKNLGQIGNAIPAIPGDDLVLSIDEKVQRLAQSSLVLGEQAARKVFDATSGIHLRADAGAVVVMDPNNGQILAMASSPSYDPRIFVGGVTQRELDRLSSPALHQPLIDRVTQADYPPGSTVKPFIALSALHRGLASQAQSYDCPAVYQIPGTTETKSNWSPVNRGFISLSEALVESCDTVFYQFGWKYWVRYYHSAPPNKQGDLTDYRDRTLELQPDLGTFGFGRPDGIDVPSEHSGRVPDPQWKSEIHQQLPKLFPYGNWLPGDYLNMVIGQGDMLVTPLQLAAGYSAIANGGTLYQPHVALRIQRPDGKLVRRIKPQVDGRLPFSKSDIAYVRQSMLGVTTSPAGTAYSAFAGFPFDKVTVAGKTGTAEVRPFQPYSWFACMAPADHPKYVVVALVEQGGHGAETAGPIARRVLEGLFGIQSGTLNVVGPKD